MDKLTNRQLNILKELYEVNDYVTSSFLADKLKVSIRTIKTEISIINNLFGNKCQIISKNGSGYLLTYSKDFDTNNFHKIEDKQLVPETNYERINYLIRKLLVVDYHLKIDDLADELFVSRSSMTQILKEIRMHLAKYRLKITSRSNYGIIIEGNEIDKRLAISEYFFHFEDSADSIENKNMFTNEYSKMEYDEIVGFIKDVCLLYNIELSDFSIHNFAIHVIIGIKRCSFYNYVICPEEILTDLQNTIEFKAANDLIKKIEEKYGFLLPIGETIYLTEHLQSKRIIENNRISIDEIEKLRNCITVIFLEINNNFGFNFSSDNELYNYLFLHIPQMVNRLRFHMTIRNPLVYDNKRRYLFATKVTHSACAIIKQFYEVDVDINEFGYLLLYFNLAITKFESNKQIRIGILTGRGRPEALMYSNEIREYFSSRKYLITDIDNLDTKDSFDLIISTYRIEKINYPTIVINNDNYIDEIREKLNEIRYHNIDVEHYFKEEFCYFELNGDTRDEVYDNFIKVLIERKIINEKPDEYNSFIDDDLGNGIVHFQDAYRIVRKSMCFICTLKKPIYWDKNLVRIFILTKTKKEGDKDLYNLCRMVSKWANDTSLVNDLLKRQSFECLLNDLKKI